MPGILRQSLVLILASVLVGCAGGDGERVGAPLLDGVHEPDVLTESRRIELPSDTGGNRFVKGWWPIQRDTGAWLAPERDGARLEIVNLGSESRSLVLAADSLEEDGQAQVAFRIGEREPVTVPLSRRLEVPLPDDLPLGRVIVELAIEGSQVGVEQAGLSRALAAGEAEIEGQDLRQAGNSLVDFVRPTEAGARLVGAFEPPSGANEDQLFQLLVEDGAGATEVAFEWRPGGWSLFDRSRGLDLPLPAGWVRIRLLARGEGPPARWRALAIDGARTDAPAVQRIDPPQMPQVVILYILDALRTDYLGHLGGPRDVSPTIDRLASEGTTFTNHLSVAPNTLPSTKSIFTGQMFLTQGGWKLPLDGPTTISESFAAAGYRTGLFTGNGNITIDQGLTRGFEVAPRRILFTTYSRRETLGYNDNAERVHDVVLQWLDQLPPDDRVFLHIQTIHPHNPFDPPEPFLGRFTRGIDSEVDGSTETLLALRQRRLEVTATDMEKIRALYAAGVAYNDAHLDSLMAEITERYPDGEVMLVITSDHGEELFDHGGVLHGYTLHGEQLRIPLIFWWPGRIEAGVVDLATDNIDLHATLNDLVGGEPVPEGGGRSLWPALTGRDQPGKQIRFAAASSVQGGIFSARTATRKFIWAPRQGNKWGMGEALGRQRDVELVFHLDTDPDEIDNRVGFSDLESAWLRSRLLAWVELGKRLEVGVPMEELDPETVDSLKALGYLQ